MKIKSISYLTLFVAIFTNQAIADQHTQSLESQRQVIISQYIADLGKADYQHIVQLFEKNGIVISTSRGKVDAKEFFYGFLPNIETATTENHQVFNGSMNNNRYAARFYFSFKLKDGEEGAGEYIDEFVFTDHSTKLTAVYMFENLKFENQSP